MKASSDMTTIFVRNIKQQHKLQFKYLFSKYGV